jgi:hypothetical protein
MTGFVGIFLITGLACNMYHLNSLVTKLVLEQLVTLKGITVETLSTRLANKPERAVTSECIIHNLKLCLRKARVEAKKQILAGLMQF